MSLFNTHADNYKTRLNIDGLPFTKIQDVLGGDDYSKLSRYVWDRVPITLWSQLAGIVKDQLAYDKY